MKKKLTVPSDLGEKARIEIASHVNELVADAFALYVKTKSFHWHLTGPHFRDYHLLFDEQAEQILGAIDTLAERSRKLGCGTITSISHIQKLTAIEDENSQTLSARVMIEQLMQDNSAVVARMRKTHDLCAEQGDCATASLLEVFIDETERRVWFLSSTL